MRDAGIGADDVVLEIGAGDGRLTAELGRRARRVVAVELDPLLVDRLRRRFVETPTIQLVHGDVRTVPLPREPFRAFGNVPFGVTNAVLRRLLDDPAGATRRVDLIVQLQPAIKRTQLWPSTVLALGWQPWWELTTVRKIGRHAFDPPPSVDAAVLRAVRRDPPLIPGSERHAFVALVRTAFEHPTWPLPRALRDVVPPLAWKRLARDRGLARDATPRDLDVWDWVRVAGLAGVTPVRTRRAAPRRSRPRTGGTTPTRS